MPRSPRAYSENTVYEIVPRTQNSLPMPPNLTANALRLGILGRAQRDNKVELCHFMDMNNHSHTIAVSTTPEKLNKFHMEVKKKTTDALKALLKLPQLSLWEKRTGVMKIATLADAIDRIVYLYCNPSNAGLCDSIEQYPGINSWKAFIECDAAIDAKIEFKVRWYPMSAIPPLPPTRALSHRQDLATYQRLQTCSKSIEHHIILKPFKWLEPFGIATPPEIETIRQIIIKQVRDIEHTNASTRERVHKKAATASALRQSPFLKHHIPKKKERKIFLICCDTEYRLSLLEAFRNIFRRCRECYEQAKAGIRVEWPPGTFIPWFPPGTAFSLEPRQS